MHDILRLIVIAVLCAPVSAFAEVDYATAFAESQRLERAGDVAGAARVVEELAAAFPQDYSAQLRLGWLRFQSGDYAGAKQAYETAYELSGGALDAALGLGWTAFRVGDFDVAESRFREVLGVAPDHASAAEGIALIEAGRTAPTPAPAAAPRPTSPWRYGAFAGVVGEVYPDSASAETTGIGGAVAAAIGYGPVAVSANYQYLQYSIPDDGMGFGARHGRRSSEGRHEVHAGIAAAWPLWGVSAHFGTTSSNPFPNGTVLGGVGRVSPFGDIALEVSHAIFTDDVAVTRVAPSWQIPLGPTFFVRPGGAFQLVDDRNLWSAAIAVGAVTKRLTVAVGGSYGKAYRVIELTVPMIQTIEGIHEFDGWASLAVDISHGWAVTGTYSATRFSPEAGSNDDFTEHGASLGIGKSIW